MKLKDVCMGDTQDFSQSFMYSIHQMYFLVQKHLEHVLSRGSSLSFSQFMILVGFKCSQNGPVSQSDIAERLYLTEATVSRHISTLVSLNYITRVEDKENRRKHVIKVTPKGTKVFTQAKTLIDKELQEIFGVIREKDRASIMKNFSEVFRSLLSKK